MVELHFRSTQVHKLRNQVDNDFVGSNEAGKPVVVTSTKSASGAQDLVAIRALPQKDKV